MLIVRNGFYGGDMTNSDYPWDPPIASTEAERLPGALDRLRTTFRFKADDLDAAGLQVRIGASALTIGGLLKHLAVCEDYMFTVRLSGAPIGAPSKATAGTRSATGSSRPLPDDAPEELYELWDDAVERSRARLNAALANGGLDQSVHLADSRRPPRQPAQAGLRPDRGVWQAHRPRRLAARSGRRAGR